mmetsp:Transcript_85677/g.190568  ORF Transcript_85677/g.190568 Transcript_85677/m.190568 type:complete len:859 (-) Transcript_85677:17-2593(-)
MEPLLSVVTLLKKAPEQRTQDEVMKIARAMVNIHFFQDLEPVVRIRCCRGLRYEFHQEGDTIFEQGEPGQLFYIILEGTVGVYIKDKDLRYDDRSQAPHLDLLHPSPRRNSGDKHTVASPVAAASAVASGLGAVADHPLDPLLRHAATLQQGTPPNPARPAFLEEVEEESESSKKLARRRRRRIIELLGEEYNDHTVATEEAEAALERVGRRLDLAEMGHEDTDLRDTDFRRGHSPLSRSASPSRTTLLPYALPSHDSGEVIGISSSLDQARTPMEHYHQQDEAPSGRASKESFISNEGRVESRPASRQAGTWTLSRSKLSNYETTSASPTPRASSALTTWLSRDIGLAHENRKREEALKHKIKVNESLNHVVSQMQVASKVSRAGLHWKARAAAHNSNTKSPKRTAKDTGFKLVRKLGRGESFGEAAMTNDQPRTATAKTLEATHFAVLQRKDFMEILADMAEQAGREKIQFLHSVPLFVGWPAEKIAQVSKAMHRRDYRKNEIVHEEGRELAQVFFIHDGEFAIRHCLNSASGEESCETPEPGGAGSALLQPWSRTQKIWCTVSLVMRPHVLGLPDYLRGDTVYSERAVCQSFVGTTYGVPVRELMHLLDPRLRKRLERGAATHAAFLERRTVVAKQLAPGAQSPTPPPPRSSSRASECEVERCKRRVEQCKSPVASLRHRAYSPEGRLCTIEKALSSLAPGSAAADRQDPRGAVSPGAQPKSADSGKRRALSSRKSVGAEASSGNGWSTSRSERASVHPNRSRVAASVMRSPEAVKTSYGASPTGEAPSGATPRKGDFAEDLCLRLLHTDLRPSPHHRGWKPQRQKALPQWSPQKESGEGAGRTGCLRIELGTRG